MNKKIKIDENKNQLCITIPSYHNNRVKALFLFYGALLTLPLFFIDNIITPRLLSFGFFPVLFVLGYAIILSLAGNNLLKLVFSKEIIEIKNNLMSITKGYFIFKNRKTYQLSLISNLNLIGFNYNQRNDVNNSGIPGYHAMGGIAKAANVDETIEFIYDSITHVKFGINLPSWDAEFVIDKLNFYLNTLDKKL